LDVFLRRPRSKYESGIAGVQMSGVSNLIGHHGAADACMFRPTDDARFEKSAIDNQLTATIEQIQEADRPLRSAKLVTLLHGQAGDPAALGCQRVTGPG